MQHEHWMRRCLELAARGRGRVGNGALVGAILVRNHSIIAEGWHRGYGELHAERDLLQKFEQKIDTKDVLYINLEPCCHTGKTPPCTDILIKSGVKRVVFGMIDPDARVAGQGMDCLKKAGIEVIGPVLRAECAWLNRGFITTRTKGRPWITLKGARTLSGEIAEPSGKPKKITNSDQDAWAHTVLRSRHDAILIGVGTILADDPKLNTRLDQSFDQEKGLNPYRIVLDSHLKTPPGARLIIDDIAHRTILIASPLASANAERVLTRNGAHVLRIAHEDKTFVWSDLWKKLITPVDSTASNSQPPIPHFVGITSILVEGGARTWEGFRKAGLVDAEVTLVGPP